MMYVFGDSFSCGYNFYTHKNRKRENIIYPAILSDKLQLPYKNFSIPGGSNWRICRIILSMNLTKEDLVIIAWSSPDRIEIGVEKNNISPGEYVIKSDDFYELENNSQLVNFQSIENCGKLHTRRVFPALIGQLNYANTNFKNFCKVFYSDFSSIEWFEEMFLVMFHATVNKLKSSNSKFIMFNTFKCPYTRENKDLDIKEYILGYKSDMNSKIKSYKKDRKYWSEQEHEEVAKILYQKIKDIYDFQ